MTNCETYNSTPFMLFFFFHLYKNITSFVLNYETKTIMDILSSILIFLRKTKLFWSRDYYYLGCEKLFPVICHTYCDKIFLRALHVIYEIRLWSLCLLIVSLNIVNYNNYFYFKIKKNLLIQNTYKHYSFFFV